MYVCMHVYVCTVSLCTCLHVCAYGYLCVLMCALTEVQLTLQAFSYLTSPGRGLKSPQNYTCSLHMSVTALS